MLKENMDFTKISIPDDHEYSSDGDNIPLEFYLEVLPRSKEIYLKLGYFSSKAIQVLSYGFALFIKNGGSIKIVTNHFLYKQDKLLLHKINNDAPDLLGDEFLLDLDWLYRNLSGTDQHLMDCLKYLVARNRLILVPVVLKPNRLAHYKQGIFVDGVGNKIFIDGSCNFTGSGLLENGESLTVFRSWGESLERKKVNSKYEDIKQIVNKSNNKYVYLKESQIYDAVKAIGKDKSLSELIDDEMDLIYQDEFSVKMKHILNIHGNRLKTILSDLENEPRFPFNSEPREYQVEAYQKWIGNGKKGIFAMATGTGKTITALNCLLNEYREENKYQVIILVPTKVLLNQWSEELSSFNFKNRYLVSSEYKWRKNVKLLNTGYSIGREASFAIVVTYATYGRDSFQGLVKNLPITTLLIADEAHNMGSDRIRKLLPDIGYSKRIALSATPKRYFDEEGDADIEHFFNDSPPYVYSFSMARAIDEGILSRYKYYPHAVELTNAEMEEYLDITRKLSNHIDASTGRYKDNDIVKSLLLSRKRVIHKAENKRALFKKIIESHILESGGLKYAFVYAPEGNDAGGNSLIDSYMQALEEVSPHCRAYSYTHHTENRRELMSNFEEGNVDVIFSMKCLDEGVDIPRAEMAIFCSSTGNPRQFIQRRGRILRKHSDKKLAIIHDLVVIPKVSDVSENNGAEKNIVIGEMKRVIDFSKMASNYYEAIESCKNIVERYGLDMFALQSDMEESK